VLVLRQLVHASCGDYCATTFITYTELHALPDFCLISPWQYGLWVWAGAQHLQLAHFCAPRGYNVALSR